MSPLLLCIDMEPERALRLSFLALSLGVRFKLIEERDWGQPLAALCGLEPPLPHSAHVQVNEEMLVMAFFPDELTDRFLQALRAGDLPPVRLKAVLTPTNQRWNCAQLCAALRNEAAGFAAGKGEKQ